MTSAPTVTVAICSRNRPDDLKRAVAAALRVLPPGAELLIVDQTSERTDCLTTPDPRARYEHRPGQGISLARNLSLHLARTDVVVFTDDDCGARPGMVESLSSAFKVPAVGLAFGTVIAETSRVGFIASHSPKRRRILRGRLAKLSDTGIGACMAVRRDAAIAVGGFDERLGPGAPLPSNEDGEFAYRMLLAGYAIAHIPEAIVDHWGARPWHDGRRYSYETYRAIAAAYAMHARVGDPVAPLLIAQQAAFILGNVGKSVLQRGRPSGFSALQGLLAGIRPGLRLRPMSTRQSATARSASS